MGVRIVRNETSAFGLAAALPRSDYESPDKPNEISTGSGIFIGPKSMY